MSKKKEMAWLHDQCILAASCVHATKLLPVSSVCIYLFPVERDLVELEGRLGLVEQLDGGHALRGLGESDIEPAEVDVLVGAVHSPEHRTGNPPSLDVQRELAHTVFHGGVRDGGGTLGVVARLRYEGVDLPHEGCASGNQP